MTVALTHLPREDLVGDYWSHIEPHRVCLPAGATAHICQDLNLSATGRQWVFQG